MTSNGLVKGNNMPTCGNSCNPTQTLEWELPQITSKNSRYHKYAVLILNRPISQSHNFMKNYWNNAAVRVTVDGGTNKWDTFLSSLSEEEQESMKAPDIITGDFDSITDEVLERYKKKGCKVVHTPDQNHTDFTKAVKELYKYCQENKIVVEHVIAICQTSGRLDQILGNIQTLFLTKEKSLLSSNMRLYIMSDDSISWLLTPGSHIITIPEESRKHKRAWCSLVPIGETCVSVTTSGLKWNLDKRPLKFGELVSTSNTFNGSGTVTVECSHTLLWSMRIPYVAS